jgi:hypothetical protein
MSKASKQLYKLSEYQLEKLVGQGTYPGAQNAWDRFRNIRGAGGSPVIFYSEFNGFTVEDDHSRSSNVIRRILSMEQCSKAFPG